jgi:hypothetical protein
VISSIFTRVGFAISTCGTPSGDGGSTNSVLLFDGCGPFGAGPRPVGLGCPVVAAAPPKMFPNDLPNPRAPALPAVADPLVITAASDIAWPKATGAPAKTNKTNMKIIAPPRIPQA